RTPRTPSDLPVSFPPRRPPAASSSTSDSTSPRPPPTARTSPPSPVSCRPMRRSWPARPRPRPSSPGPRRARAATSTPSAPRPPAPPPGPVRSRIPHRIHPPPLRAASAPAPVSPRGFGGRAGDVYTDAAGERLRIDIPRREVRIDGELVDVTTKEFDLLATLVTHADETLPREELISAVWSDGEVPDERTVDVHIRRLRRRLGEYAS